ncbi:MAG: tRNA-dihydrouridine synthase family protein, partial [Lentisphaeria bacterium]|nr:tRNA-dihydrouridine synthase family protein [Lentisphaeria bacterium]
MREPFIRTVSELKLASRWMTPFFRVTTHVPKKAKVAEFLQVFLETGLPVSGQIMGIHPERLAKTAQIMLELGCFDVDINCGCPSSRVISGGAGGGILRDLDLLKNILQALRSALPLGAFSVKTRIGYDRDRSEEVLKTILENGKPDRLFVHCRTTKEMYAPVENMSGRFDKVISLTREARKYGMSLILNGDIASVQQARLLAEKAG